MLTLMQDRVDAVIDWLRANADSKVKEGMARYAIPSDQAFGIPVGDLRKYAKELGRSHELALALWDARYYEARMLAVFVDDPKQVAPEQMDAWCADFDDWAITDTACFHLFDRTPHAFDKVHQWADAEGEFQRRAAFALIASIALHVKKADDESFIRCLPLIEAAASDGRNFVKKAVSWAMRGVANKRPNLRPQIVEMAERLAASDHKAERWVGKDVVRQLSK